MSLQFTHAAPLPTAADGKTCERIVLRLDFIASQLHDGNTCSLQVAVVGRVANLAFLKLFLTHLAFFENQKKTDKIWLFSVGKA